MTTHKNYGEPVAKESINLEEERLTSFRGLFPEVFAEGHKIDFEDFRTFFGNIVEDSPERYSFSSMPLT